MSFESSQRASVLSLASAGVVRDLSRLGRCHRVDKSLARDTVKALCEGSNDIKVCGLARVSQNNCLVDLVIDLGH